MYSGPESSYIKKMSGLFFFVAMTEKTSYRGKILVPVFLFFSGCVHPGQNFPHMTFTSGKLKTSSRDATLITVCCETSSAQKINMWQISDFYPTRMLTTLNKKKYTMT
jgi:hypothetical protein